jgi:hypothetical protein
MNTTIARQIDVPGAIRTSVPVAISRAVHELAALGRTAWEGMCSVSKANLLSQHGGDAYRRRVRRL